MSKFNTANKKLIKKINTNAILNIIKKEGPISRADIAKSLSLNPATVSSNVNDLLETKLIKEIGSGYSSGGRRPILLQINSLENYIIGVHTELTHVNAGIVNLDGKILYKIKYKYLPNDKQLDYDPIIFTIISAIKDVLKNSKINEGHIIGIGLGIHGLVDPINGKSIFAPAFNWHNINIKQIINKVFTDIPILMDNDVRVMAMGEKWYGNAVTSNNFVLLNLSEGIGGALVINNQVYVGNTFGAGEIGHIKVTQKPIRCKCGNLGCFTTMASEQGIVERMKEKIITSSNSTMNINDVTLNYIIEYAKNKDGLAVKFLEHTGVYIGKVIGIIINILNPEKIILTGTVLKAKDFFMNKIIDTAKEVSIKDNFLSTKITISTIDDDLGIIGASTLILNDLFTL